MPLAARRAVRARHTSLRLASAALLAGSSLLASPAGAQDRPNAAPLVESARAAARANRNAESAELFRQSLEQEPGRRPELLAEYADQLTYSGRAAQAVPLYRELLASASGDQRIQRLKGLGLALLWSDQAGAAVPVYEEVTRSRPDDLDARRNLAQALSWSGRQRQAVAYLQDLQKAHPADGGIKLQMAQSLAWMGRPDRAADALTGVDSEGARKLRQDLELWTAPRTQVETLRSTQSDRLNIDTLRAGHQWSFARGLGAAGVRVDRIDYELEDGSDGARVERPMLTGRLRLADAWELNAEVGNERIRSRNAAALDRTVYASWLTWWPNDSLRLDFSTNRGTFDNLRSLRKGLTARQHGVSMDVMPDERQRYTVRLDQGHYSDGNRRQHGQLEAEYRWMTKPNAWIGARHTRIAFSELLDNGYFNPKEFESTVLTLRTLWHPAGEAGRWEVAAGVALGREHAQPGGSKPVSDASIKVGYAFDPRTRLEGRAQRFSSRTASDSGFARTTYGLMLDRAW